MYGNALPMVVALNHAIYCICVGNRDTSAWNLPFNLVVPFNTETLGGWFLYWLFQLSGNIAYSLCIIIPTTHFTGFCRYIVAICNHFELLLEKIRFDFKQIRNSTKVHRQKYMEVRHNVQEQLFQLIEHHVNVLE